jgi:hypothetical protein
MLTGDSSLSVRVAPTDTEGYFFFQNLRFEDRAGNHDTITYSSGVDGFNLLWVDPVAPVVSGVISTDTNNLTGSGFSSPSGSGVVTSSGNISSIPLFVVSGTIVYDFSLFERVNDITSGFLEFNLTLTADGSGLMEYTSGVGSFLITSGSNSGADFTQFSGLLNTNTFANGLYKLSLEAIDYAGNRSVTSYFFFIDNEFEISNVRVTYDSGNSYFVEVDFSTLFTTSGSISLDTSDLKIVFTGTGTTTIDGTDKISVLEIFGNDRLLTFKVEADITRANVTGVTVAIKTSGVPKLKSINLDKPILVDEAGEAVSPTSTNLDNWDN